MRLNRLNFIVFFLIAIIYVTIQFRGINHIAPGDENAYFYMAKEVSEGKLPYRDFFYAHPPLHLFILAIIVKLFGINFFALKLAAFLPLMISSFFLYKICLLFFRNKFDNKTATLISAIALLLFLFSFEVMFKATFAMGINTSLMFVTISLYLFLRGRYFLSGIFGGLAGLARLYTLPILILIFICLSSRNFKENRFKDFLLAFCGFLLVFGAVFVILTIFFGNDFTEPVIKYHLLKPRLPGQRWIVYKNVLSENWLIISAFASSILLRNKEEFTLFYAVISAYLLFLLSLNAPAEFYFSMLFPFMALVGAYSIFDLIKSIEIKCVKILAITIISLIFLWNTSADVLFLEKFGFLEFRHLEELVSKAEATNADEKLFGDDSIVPLAALLADREIALNYIDSNEKRLTSGLTNFYWLTSELDELDLSYIILRKNKGMHQIIEMRQYVENRCKLEDVYSDVGEGIFLVYRC